MADSQRLDVRVSCPALLLYIDVSLAVGLARMGAQVQLLEKNSRDDLGGRVGEYRWRGHRWETGASLLLLPDVYRESLEALGDHEALHTLRVRPSYAVWFEESPEPVELGGEDPQGLRERLELEEKGAYDKYVWYGDVAKEYLRAGWPLFIQEKILESIGLLARFLMTALFRAWPLQSHDGQLRRLFPESPKLRALCAFNDLYVGLSPYDAPAVFSLLSAIELGDGSRAGDPRSDLGVYTLEGGLGVYARRLVAACERLGVEIRCNVEIDAIETNEGTASAAIDSKNGNRFEADFFVVNADLAAAEPKLLGKDRSRDTYDSWTYSSTSHTFLWAIDDEKCAKALRHHNVFLAEVEAEDGDGFRAAWDWVLPPKARKNSTGEVPPFNFYVCASSRTDATAAPAGADSIMVLVPTPCLEDDVDGESHHADDLTDRVREYVLKRLGKICDCENLKSHIVHERVIRPREWRKKYALRRGAVFGFSHGLDQLALFRPSRKTSRVDNVAFVGASTRPGNAVCLKCCDYSLSLAGNGVPLVLTSAELCASEVAKDLNLRYL